MGNQSFFKYNYRNATTSEVMTSPELMTTPGLMVADSNCFPFLRLEGGCLTNPKGILSLQKTCRVLLCPWDPSLFIIFLAYVRFRSPFSPCAIALRQVWWVSSIRYWSWDPLVYAFRSPVSPCAISLRQVWRIPPIRHYLTCPWEIALCYGVRKIYRKSSTGMIFCLSLMYGFSGFVLINSFSFVVLVFGFCEENILLSLGIFSMTNFVSWLDHSSS